MRKIVLRSFRGRKRELRISMIMLALIYMCGIMTILFQESFYRSRESLRYNTYGEWTGAVFGAGKETEQILGEAESTERIGRIIMQGTSWYQGERLGEAGYVDRTAAVLSRIQMAEGELPSKNAEAAISETVADRLPKPLKVGDQIEIALKEDGESKSYTLSGIVRSWGKEWNTERHELPGVLLGADEKEQEAGETYLLFQNYNTNETNNIQKRIEVLEAGTYVYNEKAYPIDMSAVDVFFQDGKFVFFMVLVAAILIGYLMMLTLKSRRYSLTILRGMGADAKEILQMVLWEALFLWGAAFLTGMVFGILGTGAALFCVHMTVKIPVHVRIQAEYILEYIGCVTVIYFMCNLAVALTVIRSQIRTTFKSDSGLLDRSTPPRLKRAETLTFFVCMRRRWAFYGRIYIVRLVISTVVMAVSAICLQTFIEAKNKYEFWMGAIEPAYYYRADDLGEGLTEDQVLEIQRIGGVKSVEKDAYINVDGMMQDKEEIKVSSPVFRGSSYVSTHRRYIQKRRSIPHDKDGDYFSLWELRGISPEDSQRLSYYEKTIDLGEFHKESFAAGEECVLILPPYQIRDLGAGKEPVYVNAEELDDSKEIYTYEIGENAIAPGDLVEISTPWGTEEIKVGGIITRSDSNLYIEDYVIAVSEEFLKHLCGLEEARYAAVKINLDEAEDTIAAGKEIESYFEALGKQSNLTDAGSTVRGFAEDSLFDGTQYLFILTGVWLVYMLMMYQGNQAYLKNEGKRIGIFRALGMDKKTLKSRYLLENLSEGAAVILLSFVIVTGEFLIRLRRNAPYDSIYLLFRTLEEHPEEVRLFVLALFIAGTVFLGVSAVTLYGPLVQLSGRNIDDNLGGGERK